MIIPARHLSVRLGLSTILLCTTACSSKQTGNSQAGPSEQLREVEGRPLASFSTQELLRGLVFGDGPVADHLPTIQAQYHLSSAVRDPQALQTMREFIEQTVAKIMLERAEFADRFRKDILSSDHLRIRHAMEEGAVVATNVMVEDPDFQAALHNGFAADNSRGLCAFFVVGFVAVAYAVVFNAAAAILNVGLVVNVAVLLAVQAWVEVGNPWFGAGTPPADLSCPGGQSPCTVDRATSALMADQLISEIAEQGVEVWAYEGERLEYRTKQIYTDGRAGWLLGHGDFDGDGRQDRLYWPEKGTSYQINTARGAVAEGAMPGDPKRLYVGDFNGDGRDDILGYVEGSGAGTFHYLSSDLSTTERTLQLNPSGSPDYVPIIGRFVPPDRTDDVLMWGFGSNRELLFAGGAGQTLIATQAPVLDEGRESTAVVGAFYQRKEVDSLLMYTAGQTLHRFYNFESTDDTGTTRPGDQQTEVFFQEFYTSDHPFYPVVADFDGNGWDDIYWYSQSDSSIGDSIYASDGRAFIKYPDLKPDEAPPDPQWGQPENGLLPVAFDIDGNGRPDLFWWRIGYTRP